MNDLTPTLEFWEQEVEVDHSPFNEAMYAYYLFADQQSDLALWMLEDCLRQEPNYLKAEILKGVIHLSRGEYLQGWKHLEKRNEYYKYGGIQWDGQPTNEKVLFWDNEGFGDFIMYARFLPQIKKLCPNMQIACKPELESLIKGSFPDIEVIPYHQTATYHCPMTSVGAVLNVTLDNIPNEVPYIRTRLYKTIPERIGLHWKTDHLIGERYFVKSIPGSIMEPLIDREDTISLHVEDLKSGSFAETAAIIKNLDLVITGDTVIAHLAGALGIRTWVLLSHDCDWRWLTKRLDSPWYPTVRLFRQTELNDWLTVVNEVMVELRKWENGSTTFT